MPASHDPARARHRQFTSVASTTVISLGWVGQQDGKLRARMDHIDAVQCTWELVGRFWEPQWRLVRSAVSKFVVLSHQLLPNTSGRQRVDTPTQCNRCWFIGFVSAQQGHGGCPECRSYVQAQVGQRQKRGNGVWHVFQMSKLNGQIVVGIVRFFSSSFAVVVLLSHFQSHNDAVRFVTAKVSPHLRLVVALDRSLQSEQGLFRISHLPLQRGDSRRTSLASLVFRSTPWVRLLRRLPHKETVATRDLPAEIKEPKGGQDANSASGSAQEYQCDL